MSLPDPDEFDPAPYNVDDEDPDDINPEDKDRE